MVFGTLTDSVFIHIQDQDLCKKLCPLPAHFKETWQLIV